MKMAEGPCYSVKVDIPLHGDGAEFGSRITELEEWADKHCSDQYVVMFRSIVFSSEKDALIFKLKYG